MSSNKHIKWLRIADILAQESKCVSYCVGAVLVKDDRIISTGYNGTPSGFVNCNEKFKEFKDRKMTKEEREVHSAWSNMYEVHAEMNVIAFAARNGIKTEGTTLYCTHRPCHPCLKNAIQAGVSKVIYQHDYDKDLWTDETYELIKSSKLEVKTLKQVLDEETEREIKVKVEVVKEEIKEIGVRGYWEELVRANPDDYQRRVEERGKEHEDGLEKNVG